MVFLHKLRDKIQPVRRKTIVVFLLSYTRKRLQHGNQNGLHFRTPNQLFEYYNSYKWNLTRSGKFVTMATARNYRENIIKQGYLKKSVQSSELNISVAKQIKTNLKQKLEPQRWYVFGVRNRIPYLEYFDKEESVFVCGAVETFDLSTFERLSYTMGTTMSVYSFCIYLRDGMIELTAANRTQMLDWCRTLERHLSNLGYGAKRGTKEDHTYSDFPVKYEPKHTGLEAEQLMEQEVLTVDLLNKGDKDDGQENLYEDIPERKSILKDENHNDTNQKPPNLDEEDVFASIYSVKREALDPPCHKFADTDEEQDVTDDFESCDLYEGFDKLRDQHKSDDFDSYYKEVTKVKAKEVEDIGHDLNYFDNERCVSLPIYPIETSGTSGDTSEDQDFISASFWLQNRKTNDLMLFDVDDPIIAKHKLPPQPPDKSEAPPPVPRRLESMRGPVRQCISMTEDLLMNNRKMLAASPTLDLLGEAPKPGQDTKLVNYSPELPKRVLPGNKSGRDSDTIQKNDDLKVKSDLPMDRNESDSMYDDEIGDYEDVLHKTDDLKHGDTEDTDEGIYEPAWMCKSRREDFPHKEKQFVNLPDEPAECSKKDRNTSIKDKFVKQKRKLSLKLSRKNKSHELPTEISVSGSTRHSSAEDETDQNLYSDFPSDQVPKLEPKTPEAAHSDICKISLENDPSQSGETSPVLPRRNKISHSNSKSPDPGRKHLPTSRVKSVPSPPNPPRKLGGKSITTDNLLMNGKIEAAPIAPPRRNRKTIHGNMLQIESNNQDTSVVNDFSRSTNGRFFQPKRELPPVPPVPNMPEKDLPLPPRKEKPARPPRFIDNDHMRPDIPNRGARPKSINITKRQISTESAGLTVMNLKQNQVDILRSEIDMTNGMKKTVSKLQFQEGLALVECFERIWIAGWDLKNFPRLYDKFHIGDQLIAINDVHVTEVSFAMKMVKNVKVDTIDVTVKRLPLAKVFALQRTADGQNLGFKRDGGTAEIIYVDPHGVAAKHGLQSKAFTTDFACNWWLTEINMRPINLFFKDDEIKHRLLAVGRDISIVVQPADFVKELRKQLKKVKGYKDFLVQ